MTPTNPTVYKIYCKDDKILDIYIGSTCNFNRRQNDHRSRSKTQNTKLYVCIRDNGGWSNWNMTPIRIYKFDMTRNELIQKERKYFKIYKATLNKQVPGRTMNEYQQKYRQDNIEHLIQYQQKYKQDNKETIRQYQQKYKQDNRDRINENRRNRRKKRMELKTL
jgi:archaellin